MPGPKLFGIEDAGEEETEPPTGRVVHETARVHELLAGMAVVLPVAFRAQQLSIWTIESFNIPREPMSISTSTFARLRVLCSERCDSARAPARVVYRSNH
jgi:hypothetical protein